MENPCPHHNNPIIAVCLYKSCNSALLCLKCLRTHNEDHDTSTYNVYDLTKNQEWLEPFEKQRDELVQKEKEISEQRGKVVSSCQSLVEVMLDSIAKIAMDQKERLSEELKNMTDSERNKEVKELFTKLDGDTESLQKINFRDGNDLDKINQVKAFNEALVPNTEGITQLSQDTITSWKLDENKMNLYKEELAELLQSIHLKDLLAATPFKSLKETDTFLALRATNERLEIELRNKTEQCENEFQKPEQREENVKLDNGGNGDFTAIISERDELRAKNNELNQNVSGLMTAMQDLTSLKDDLENQNAILNREVSQLASELSNYRRRNSHPQTLDRRIQSCSGNGLFG